MKLDTKVSSRDKNLLVFLIVLLILFLAYYFFFQPQLEQFLATKSDLDKAQSELANIDQEIKSLPDLQNQEKAKLAKIDQKVQPFFYELRDDRLLYQFNTLMGENNLKLQSYTVARATVATIEPVIANISPSLDYPALDAAAKVNPDIIVPKNNGQNADANAGNSSNNGQNTAPEDSLLISGLTINFSGTTYASFIGFIKSVEAMNKAIVINNINIAAVGSQNGGGGLLQGQVQFNLYSLAKPDNTEKDYLLFNRIIPQGKTDPFN